MPKPVVDLLEAVEVEQGERHRCAGALRDRPLASRKREEAAAVEQAGQRVGVGAPTQARAEVREHERSGPHGAGHDHPHDRHVGQTAHDQTHREARGDQQRLREDRAAGEEVGHVHRGPRVGEGGQHHTCAGACVGHHHAHGHRAQRHHHLDQGRGCPPGEDPQPHAHHEGEHPDRELQLHGLPGADGEGDRGETRHATAHVQERRGPHHRRTCVVQPLQHATEDAQGLQTEHVLVSSDRPCVGLSAWQLKNSQLRCKTAKRKAGESRPKQLDDLREQQRCRRHAWIG